MDHTGTGDEYNEDARESDDGAADTGSFLYTLQGVEGGARNAGRQINQGTGDRRWHDMYR